MRCLRFLLLLAFSLQGSSVMAQVAGETSLAQLRDKARVLLVFAPKPDDARLEIQVRTLEEHAAAAQERDLVVIGLPYHNASPTPAQLSADEAEATRRRFQVAPDEFAVILIGKDGGSKLRSKEPLSMNRLERTIDAMPMRQEEMRSRPQM